MNKKGWLGNLIAALIILCFMFFVLFPMLEESLKERYDRESNCYEICYRMIIDEDSAYGNREIPLSDRLSHCMDDCGGYDE